MKILFVSPLGFSITPQTRYAGIEKLVWYYSRELVKNHEVTVMGHADSIFPQGVKVFPHIPENNQFDPELKHYQTYQSEFRKFDVIHDFSHLHLISRFNPNMPTLNIFWHAPALAKYEKAPYNIIALSKWAEREFRRIYHQEAKYQYSIGIDTELYKLSNEPRNDRFFALGRMGAEKGNLEAAMFCKEAGVPLDIQGARGSEHSADDPLTDYEKKVLALCDDKQIKYLGDLPEAEKIKKLQTSKALLYPTNHPEVTSHKNQEAMLCGMPVIVSGIGAAPELITHGVNGYLCHNEDEFLWAMANVDKLQPDKVYEEIKYRFDIKTVVADYIPLYEKVAGGLRWA